MPIASSRASGELHPLIGDIDATYPSRELRVIVEVHAIDPLDVVIHLVVVEVQAILLRAVYCASTTLHVPDGTC